MRHTIREYDNTEVSVSILSDDEGEPDSVVVEHYDELIGSWELDEIQNAIWFAEGYNESERSPLQDVAQDS